MRIFARFHRFDGRWRCYNTSREHMRHVIKTALFNRPGPYGDDQAPDWAIGRDHL